jgi:hypothetical protein
MRETRLSSTINMVLGVVIALSSAGEWLSVDSRTFTCINGKHMTAGAAGAPRYFAQYKVANFGKAGSDPLK